MVAHKIRLELNKPKKTTWFEFIPNCVWGGVGGANIDTPPPALFIFIYFLLNICAACSVRIRTQAQKCFFLYSRAVKGIYLNSLFLVKKKQHSLCGGYIFNIIYQKRSYKKATIPQPFLCVKNVRGGQRTSLLYELNKFDVVLWSTALRNRWVLFVSVCVCVQFYMFAEFIYMQIWGMKKVSLACFFLHDPRSCVSNCLVRRI